MVFKKKIVKNYLELRHSLGVSSIFQIDNINVGDEIDINSDCEIAYFVDMDSTPGYDRFNMKQMLNVVQLDFSDLLSYVRKKKLDKLY